MSTSYLTHHLYPDNPHLFIIDIRRVTTVRGESNTLFWRNRAGEEFWKMFIYTSGIGYNGERLSPFIVDIVDSSSTLDVLVSDKISEIAQLIDWSKSPIIEGTLSSAEDKYPPAIIYQYPSYGQTGVDINSMINIRVRDFPPANGVDLSSVYLNVNGFTVTPIIEGNKYDFSVSYKPHVED